MISVHKRQVEWVVLVSDDSGFGEILWEPKERCLRTAVIGNLKEGASKRWGRKLRIEL